MIRKFLLASTLALTLGFQASAAILISWDFNGLDGNQSSVDANLNGTIGSGVSTTTGGIISLSPDSSAIGVADSFGPNDWGTTGSTYVEFTIAPQSGYTMTISSIDLSFLSGFATPPDGFVLYSSQDGFANPIDFYPITPESDNFVTGGDLSLIFADLEDPITFRLYTTPNGDSGTSLGFTNTSGNSIIVNGTTTAVPEPGTYALVLVGLAGMALIVRARRQRKLLAVQA